MKIANNFHIIGFVIIIATSIFLALLVYYQISLTIEKQQSVDHSYKIIFKFGNLLSLLKDSETGVRGYVITHNSTFLEPYNQAIPQINIEYNNLLTLTKDDPDQQMRLANLQPLIVERLDILNKQKNLLDIGSNYSENYVVTGKQIMDNIREITNNATNEEQILLDKKNKETDASNNLTIIISSVASLGIGITSSIIFYIINRNMRSTLRIQNELEDKKKSDIVKDEFAAMVSHELKTPLMPILWHAKMLKDVATDAEQLESLEAIEKNAKRLEMLLGDIMDARKLDLDRMKFNIEETPLDSFFAEMNSAYKQTLASKEIKFTTEIPHGIIIKADRVRLRQVFDNLINNALKFLPKNNGIIDIVASKKDKDLIMCVKDNGPGIPPEKQKELFQKFYQIDTSERRKISGTGLGLVISKGIVEKHNGSIWIESDGKNGTSVFIKLPL